jgi:hypothetical protein
MRRLAREAIIFMLAGLVLAPIGLFVWEHHEAFASLQLRQDAEKKRSAECLAKARETFSTSPLSASSLPMPIPADCLDLSAGFVLESNWQPIVIPIIGLYGFIGGFVLWLFYRLIYFAATG